MKQTFKLSWVLIALLALTVVSACKKDDDDDNNVQEVTAGFEYEIDADDALTVHFTNLSENETSVSWDFGDGETSTDENPTHTYDAEGAYTVKLTATNAGGSDVVQQTVNVVDANAQLTKLTGGDQKEWILVRETVENLVYPLQVGPASHAEIWWAFGKGNDLAERTCLLDDRWTFKADGSVVFDDNDTYWAEGGVYHPDLENQCQESTPANMYGPNNEDLSAWASATHQWTLEEGQLTLTGLGAYIGLSKAATGAEVKVPQESVTYNIISLTDAAVDTLIVETEYTTGGDNPQPAYWRFVLVHYDDPNQEPPIPGPSPSAGFDMSMDGLTITFTNTTVNGQTYLWEFGDGNTSTEQNPTHTYATGGIYDIKLTATNANGSGEANKTAFVSEEAFSEAFLLGTWKIRVAEKSIFVGPGMGSPDWWATPLNFLNGGAAGTTDDWQCITNDEFIFSAGGVYEYKTNGDWRNDGYANTPENGLTNGCISDDALAGSPAAPFGSAIHSYSLDLSGPRPVITLTNGGDKAAFIGFYKGFYGGENSSNANLPNGGNTTNQYEVMGHASNGTTDYLFLSVDISETHDASKSWSVILEKPTAN